MTPEARARQEAGWAKLQDIMEDEELSILDIDIWYQISRRYRAVARVPEGMTPQQALLDATLHYEREMSARHGFKEPDVEYHTRHVNSMNDEAATCRFGDFAVRYPDRYPDCYREVNHKTFMAFKKAGGGTTMARFYDRKIQATEALK